MAGYSTITPEIQSSRRPRAVPPFWHGRGGNQASGADNVAPGDREELCACKETSALHGCGVDYAPRMVRNTAPPSRVPFAIEKHGKTHWGQFYVQGKLITVIHGGRTKTAQLGGSPAEAIGKQLLSELVGDAPQPSDKK